MRFRTHSVINTISQSLDLCDRFGIQDQGRERPVLTLLADSSGHIVRGHDRLAQIILV